MLDFAKRHLVMSFLLFVFLLFALEKVYEIIFPPSVAESQARSAALQAQKDEDQRRLKAGEAKEARQQAELEEERHLCHLKTACKTYATVRQDCAKAENFNNCIKVRMGDDDAGLTGSCSNDGKLLYPPLQVPNLLVCLFD